MTSLHLPWPGDAYAAYRYLQRAITRKHDGKGPEPVVALTGIAELVLRGVETLEPPSVPMLVTHPLSRSRRVFHRHRAALETASVEEVKGFQTTGVAWALAEAATRLPRTTFDNTISWLDRSGMLPFHQLRSSAEQLHDDIGAHLHRVLSGVTVADVRARSGAERNLYRGVVDAGLRAPLVNHEVNLGGRTFEVDLYWPPERALIIEVDGPSHDLMGQRRKDDGRDDAARREGVRLERVTAKQVDDDLDGVVAWIAAILAGWA